jgi:hypothetical protein
VRFGEGDGATGITGGRCDRDSAENPDRPRFSENLGDAALVLRKGEVTVCVDHDGEGTGDEDRRPVDVGANP